MIIDNTIKNMFIFVHIASFFMRCVLNRARIESMPYS